MSGGEEPQGSIGAPTGAKTAAARSRIVKRDVVSGLEQFARVVLSDELSVYYGEEFGAGLLALTADLGADLAVFVHADVVVALVGAGRTSDAARGE